MDKVLIVDDDLMIRAFCEDLLIANEYKTVTAKNPEECLEKLKNESIDIVLLDVMLPGRTGLELLPIIKKVFPEVEVIIMTAFATLENAIEAIKKGAYDYIRKPADPEEFLHAVSKASEKRRLDGENKRLLLQLRNLEEKIQELTVVGKKESQGISILDSGLLLDKIINLIAEALDVEIVSLMLVDEKTGELAMKAAKGLDEQVIKNTRKKIGEGVAGWVLKEKKPLFIKDISSDPRFAEATFSSTYKTKSLISIPLKVEDKVIGVLSVNNKVSGANFSEHDFALLNTFSRQIIASIENIRLYERVSYLKEFNENIVESVPTGIVVMDKRGIVLAYNAAQEKITGLRRDEVVGKDFFSIDAVAKQYNLYKNFEELITTGKPYTISIDDIKIKEGGKANLYLRTYPLLEHGQITGAVQLIDNVTEQKQIEQKLIQTEKLSSLGGMIAGIAHELNNKLAPILAFSELLERSIKDEKDLKKIRAVIDSVLGAGKIVKSLLGFSRQHRPQKTYINLNERIENVLIVLKYRLRACNINLIQRLDSQLPWTMADKYQVEQVFLNIMNNAYQTMEETGGELKVESFVSRNNIVVKISDTGPGIPKDILSRIFDPFFTTKEEGKGTGLGLSVCYGIIKEHLGSIDVQSEVGKGTSFIIELPIKEEEIKKLEEEKGLEKKAEIQKGKKILIVDDDVSLLEVMLAILTGDYGVTKAINGQDALDKIKKDNFDIIISDLRMPGVDGIQLYDWVKDNKPGLEKKIIFTTGDTFTPKTKEFLDETGNKYIPKPFRVDDFLEIIQKVLG